MEMKSTGCWHDISMKSPEKPGFYRIEDVNNDYHYGYFDGNEKWYIRYEYVRVDEDFLVCPDVVLFYGNFYIYWQHIRADKWPQAWFEKYDKT
jgi:hypothetical protein